MTITEGYRRALVLACKQLVRECVKTCPIAQGRGARGRQAKYCWHAKEPCYMLCLRYLMAEARKPAKRKYSQPTWRSQQEKDEHEREGS